MAEIAPFKGIRYGEAVISDFSRVTSPPYDIISSEEQTYFYNLHPNNFVRLILGEELPEDNETENKFTRARQYLDEWLSNGVLKQDKQPAIYVYEQQFERDGKSKSIRGFTAAVKLHSYDDKVILPHEQTLAKPKSMLAQLIRHVKANLDCVYGLYDDEAHDLDKVMDKTMAAKPLEAATDRDGVRNLFWAITDPAEIRRVVEFMMNKQIAIADGHHRYETALAYRDEVRSKMGYDGNECRELASDYVMMTLINVYEEDMTIFPTHRVLGALSEDSLADLEKNLSELFKILPTSRETILEDMARESAIGMYRKGNTKLLKPTPRAMSEMEGSEASRKLELNVLHKLALEKYLGIDQEKLRNQTHIIYTRDAEEAMDLVDKGERQIVFLVNQIPVKSVLDIASAGEKMPQKATYFYPKLLSGLVLRKLE